MSLLGLNSGDVPDKQDARYHNAYSVYDQNLIRVIHVASFIASSDLELITSRPPEDLPLISDAFRTGRLSFSNVRAMTRVATPENEDYLMMVADHGTAAHVERLVRGYRQVKRTEALEQENRRHELREVSWRVDDDGSYVIERRLPRSSKRR